MATDSARPSFLSVPDLDKGNQKRNLLSPSVEGLKLAPEYPNTLAPVRSCHAFYARSSS